MFGNALVGSGLGSRVRGVPALRNDGAGPCAVELPPVVGTLQGPVASDAAFAEGDQAMGTGVSEATKGIAVSPDDDGGVKEGEGVELAWSDVVGEYDGVPMVFPIE